jgi:hypothetical protein
VSQTQRSSPVCSVVSSEQFVSPPLAQVADQVFSDLVRELERQGVSRKVGADTFGMMLRSYQRRIQPCGESSTERGRSLWEAVLDYLRAAARSAVLLGDPCAGGGRKAGIALGI